MGALMSNMVQRQSGINQILMMNHAGFVAEPAEAFKNNMILDGFSLKAEGRKVAPMVYMNDDLMMKTDTELAELFENVFRGAATEIPEVKNILNREWIIAHVRPRLYSSENMEYMDQYGVAYIKMEDVPLVVGFFVEVDEINDGHATVVLKNNHLEIADIEVSELWNAAISNLDPDVTVDNMYSVLSGLIGDNADEMIPGGIPMWIVSNSRRLFGAASILCPSAEAELVNRLGNRFVLLPSSIHELICIPDNDADAVALAKMVSEINTTTVSVEDKLSDAVMVYDDGVIRPI